ISRLAELLSGWDGGTSPPLSDRAKQTAWCVLEQLERYDELPTPQVGPTVGGGLGIEWDNGSRALDIEILPDSALDYLRTQISSSGGVDRMDDGTISPAASKEELRQLAR